MFLCISVFGSYQTGAFLLSLSTLSLHTLCASFHPSFPWPGPWSLFSVPFQQPRCETCLCFPHLKKSFNLLCSWAALSPIGLGAVPGAEQMLSKHWTNDRILLFFLILNFSRAHTYRLYLLLSFLSRFCSLPPPVSPRLTLSEVRDCGRSSSSQRCVALFSPFSCGCMAVRPPHLLLRQLFRNQNLFFFFFLLNQDSLFSFLFICLLNGANAFPRFSTRLCSLWIHLCQWLRQRHP